MKRFFLCILLLLALTVCVTSCGGDQAPGGSPSETERTTVSETDAASPETEETAAEAVTEAETTAVETTAEETTAEETTAEETTAEETTAEEVTTAPAISVTIASYNIKHGQDVAYDWSKLAELILQSGADIVGLQEVDMGTNRIEGRDTLAGLSEACGYPYYYFTSAMDFDGGQYGTAILSRYPLSDTATISLPSPGGEEPRAFGVATVMLPNGATLRLLNTHLSYEDLFVQSVQFTQISKWIRKNVPEGMPVAITGDFNTADFTAFKKLVELNFSLVNNEEHSYPTFRGNDTPIDNIVYRTAHLTPMEHGYIDSDRSDHNLLWCRFEVR